jgi:hypothetical protein
MEFTHTYTKGRGEKKNVLPWGLGPANQTKRKEKNPKAVKVIQLLLIST